jgi:hypothetical protein
VASLPRPLELYQPSLPLTDDEDGLWYFRLTAADPERKANGLAEVKEQVEHDWLLIESVKLAREAAEKFIATARQQGFESTAQKQSRLTLQSEFFNRGGRVMGLHLEDDLALRFTSQTPKLLAAKAAGQNPAMAVVELSKQGRVFATRLDDLRTDLRDEDRGYVQMLATYPLRTEMERQLEARWFDYASVVQRMAYVPEGRDKPVPVQEPKGPQNLPLF